MIELSTLRAISLEVSNSPQDVEKISIQGVKGRKAVLHVEVAEEKLRHLAVLSLTTPNARIATVLLSQPGFDAALSRPPSVPPPGQLGCPRCGTPVFSLKLLNRNYCFKCKTYV